VIADASGYLASALVFVAFCMKEMIPLRVVALFSNLAFIAYGLELDLHPICLLHAILLPMNGWRLWQLLSRNEPSDVPLVAQSNGVLNALRSHDVTI
jgi:CRP/FNR family transcriptional regulator, cyclic AMP receptor protein